MVSDERLIRKIFSQVVAGYSLAKLDQKIVYIKHFSSIDLLEFDFRYEEYLKNAQNRGLPNEQEKIELLIKDNLWSARQEEDIEKLKNGIRQAITDKRSHYNPNEIAGFNNQIKEYEKQLHTLLLERLNLIGETSESFARRKVDIEQILDSFYIDDNLKEKVFKSEDEEEKLDTVISIYNDFNREISDDNIRKVAISPDFQSLYGMSENLYYFYGRPLSKLTEKQSKMGSFGAYYKQILHGEFRPPQEILDDPDKIDDWWSARQNLEKVLQRADEDGKAISLVGMSAKELKDLGVETQDNSKRFIKAAENNNGEISGQQMKLMGLLG